MCLAVCTELQWAAMGQDGHISPFCLVSWVPAEAAVSGLLCLDRGPLAAAA